MADNDLVVRISHSLGAAEARRRIAGSVDALQREYATFLRTVETKWDANRLSFRVSALAQNVEGDIRVQETYVELTARLPTLIRLLAKRFVPVIRNTAQKLLR